MSDIKYRLVKDMQSLFLTSRRKAFNTLKVKKQATIQLGSDNDRSIFKNKVIPLKNLISREIDAIYLKFHAFSIQDGWIFSRSRI